MPAGERSDFFLSRRGSVAAVAREVADVLTERGYTVVVQDYDFPLGSDFFKAMHEALQNARDLIVLFTRDYENSPYTRKEFTSFKANRLHRAEERRLIILRSEDVAPLGLFAGNIYQDLVGVDDPAERRRRIIAAAEGRSQAQRPPPRPFVGMPPRNPSFTGRVSELDRLDTILIGGDKPAAITQASVGRAGWTGKAQRPRGTVPRRGSEHRGKFVEQLHPVLELALAVGGKGFGGCASCTCHGGSAGSASTASSAASWRHSASRLRRQIGVHVVGEFAANAIFQLVVEFGDAAADYVTRNPRFPAAAAALWRGGTQP